MPSHMDPPIPKDTGLFMRQWFPGSSRWLILIGAAVVLWACSEDSGPAPIPVCAAPVTLQVTPGSAPTISWTPTCRASRLLIVNADPGAIPCLIGFWFVGFAPDSAGLLSPLVYPQAPAGATVNTGCQIPLPIGDSIRVTLFVPAPQLPDTVAAVAVQTFTQ
jgi:hypothetical protein